MNLKNKKDQYEKRYEDDVFVFAQPQDVFEYVDDYSHFYSHVLRFARILGGSMSLRFDSGNGRTIGSHIYLAGTLFGKPLSIEEVVTKRESPRIKQWETVGEPQFLIVGRYQMNIAIEPQDKGSVMRVSFDYDSPARSGRIRKLLNRVYAKLCVKEMIMLTTKHFKHS